MDTKEILEHLQEVAPDSLLADGFEEAIIGTSETFEAHGDTATRVLYDRDKCIEILMQRDGMSEEDAVEYFEFNVMGAYVGPKMPSFATILR